MGNPREHILQTACNLLEKQGYYGTGLNEIVKESGAPKGSLYHYFPEGKEQITSEAVLQAGKVTAQRIQDGLSGDGNAAKAIHDFVLNIANHVESSDFAAGSPLTAVAMETASKSERINLACRDAYTLLTAAFREKLIENGYTKAKADEFATFITAAVEGGIILSRTYHTGNPLRTVAKHLKILLSQ
ncbi:MAG: TetR/AcrR family transcriptional regulator [Chloroflexi bacterium]|nr:TetR/AcrR family transcriptional regulator [Chloroflexota bacterium]